MHSQFTIELPISPYLLCWQLSSEPYIFQEPSDAVNSLSVRIDIGLANPGSSPVLDIYSPASVAYSVSMQTYYQKVHGYTRIHYVWPPGTPKRYMQVKTGVVVKSVGWKQAPGRGQCPRFISYLCLYCMSLLTHIHTHQPPWDNKHVVWAMLMLTSSWWQTWIIID